MATPAEVSALEQIRMHLLEEFSTREISFATDVENQSSSNITLSINSSSLTPSDSFFSQSSSNESPISNSVYSTNFFDFSSSRSYFFERSQVLDFTIQRALNSNNRKPLLHIKLPAVEKLEWIDVSVSTRKNSGAEENRHYRGVRQSPWANQSGLFPNMVSSANLPGNLGTDDRSKLLNFQSPAFSSQNLQFSKTNQQNQQVGQIQQLSSRWPQQHSIFHR